METTKIMCFNILIFLFLYGRSPLRSSGQRSDPEVRVRFPSYQMLWEVVGLERGPLSLVSTVDELLGRKSSGSGLENRDYSRRDPLC
jgi:hypothetical protein